MLEFVRRDALALIVPAHPVPPHPDLKALPVGRREDGLPWLVKLHGTHVLIAGATGAGKASLLWSLIRAMFPLMQAGLARVLAADPKLMELAFGRVIFDTYGAYAADPESIAVMLEQAVADMQARAARFAGVQRDHTPTIEDPFTVVLVDEVAFLTAYQPDRKRKDRIMAALATLTTQGRAVGYCVVAALQDPRKDVLTIRNLFPDRIAMRLDEPEQVDMVLGDGARDRGATHCEADLSRSGCRRRGGVRPAGSRPPPGAGPRRMDLRYRHPGPGRCLHAGACRVAGGSMTAVTAWRTDEPCPVCATGLIMTDDGSSIRAECRLCGWGDTWTGDEADGGDQ